MCIFTCLSAPDRARNCSCCSKTYQTHDSTGYELGLHVRVTLEHQDDDDERLLDMAE